MSIKHSRREANQVRRAINTKITDDLRAKLEDAALRKGWSLSAEIEMRLLASIGKPEAFPSIEAAVERAIARALGSPAEPIGSPPPVYRQ